MDAAVWAYSQRICLEPGHFDNNAAQEELQVVRQDARAELQDARLELDQLPVQDSRGANPQRQHRHTYAKTSTTNAYEVLKRRGMQDGT
jgi:hypothetical protein